MADKGKKGDKSTVKVMVRIRPFNSRELAGLSADEYPTSILHFEDRRVTLLDKSSAPVDNFDFHETFWSIPESQKQYGIQKPFADQEFVFGFTGKPAVEHALSAKHCCVFAYGQTGTGKSYTMLGSPTDPGIAPRIVDHLFERLEEMGGKAGGWDTEIEVSFMEIYNEKVKDLLVEEAASLGFIASSMVGAASGRRKSGDERSPGGRRGSNAAPIGGSPVGGPSSPPARSPTGGPSSPPAKRTMSKGPGSPVSPQRSGTHLSAPGAGRRGSIPAGADGGGGRRGSAFGLAPAPDDEYADLKVRQSPEIGVFVDGLCRLGKEQGLTSAADFKAVMRRGMEHRATAETQMNATSSRSHAIFQICVRMSHGLQGKKRYAHLNLVDLAGSERVTMSGATGQTFVEATRINLSLSTLRRVIDTLVENQKKKVKDIPPFRESMLTWVLSESLGGNSETMMLATVSPAESNREDTYNTLRYAAKAKKIENVVRVNEQQGNVALGAMQAEMQRLRMELQQAQQASEGDGSLAKLGEAADQAQKRCSEELEELESERLELQRRQEALLEQEEERIRLEQESRELREQGVEEQHASAEELHRRAEEAHRRAEEVRRNREEEARIKEKLAALEAKQRDELEQLRKATEQRKHAQETEANLLRRKQFALAFSKAFRKTTDQHSVELLRKEVRETDDHAYQGQRDLQALAGQIRELECSKGFLLAKVQTTEKRLADLQRTSKETLERKRKLVEEHRQGRGEHESAVHEHRQRRQEVERLHAAERSEYEHTQAQLQDRRREGNTQRERRRRRGEELLAKIERRGADIEHTRKQEVSAKSENETLQVHVRDESEVTERKLQQISDLEAQNARLREERARLHEEAAAAEQEDRALRDRMSELDELVSDRQRSHDELKRFVSQRFFAAGVRHGPSGVEGEATSPRSPPSSSRRFVDSTERVWSGKAYIMSSARGERSRSPEYVRTSPRQTATLSAARKQSLSAAFGSPQQ